jgi:SAM-dependent methyltransferase
MIAKATGVADRELTPAERERLTLSVAFADDLPVPDGSIDVAISSFVLQLVPNRFRALREARRVLRPGGVLAWISWLADSRPWLPDDDFDDALEDIDEEPRDWGDGRNDDLRDERAAAAQMRRAGFADVGARAGRLVHPFDVDGAIGFLTEFDEEDLVAKANSTIYGLVAGVWTRDVARAHRVAHALKAGTVYVNCYHIVDAVTPWGGYRQSGWGRELGPYALDLYTELKNVIVDIS